MVNPKSGYASYLLRLRRAKSDHQCIWVASVECMMTGKHHSFSGVDDLVQFLQAEFGGETTVEVNDQGRLPGAVIGLPGIDTPAHLGDIP